MSFVVNFGEIEMILEKGWHLKPLKTFLYAGSIYYCGIQNSCWQSKRGGFRFYRPDDLAIDVIKGLMSSVPQLEAKRVDDVIVGNAVPEAEQGLQVGRIIAARALGFDVPGMTVNRYCASGLETISIATAKIRMGLADCIIAGVLKV